VYLNLKKDFPSSDLEIKVKGREKLKWQERVVKSQHVNEDGITEYEYEWKKFKKDKDVFFIKLNLFDFDSVAPAGQYTFPFSFTLPADAPGSFFYEQGRTKAYIRYSVKVKMDPDEDKIDSMSFKQRLVIREPPPQDKGQEAFGRQYNPKGCCCCCDRGQGLIETQFEKHVYSSNEIARALTNIDASKVSAKAESAAIELYQTISLKHKHFRF